MSMTSTIDVEKSRVSQITQSVIDNIGHVVLLTDSQSQGDKDKLTSSYSQFGHFLRTITHDRADKFIVGGHSHWFKSMMTDKDIVFVDESCNRLNLTQRLLENTEIIKLGIRWDGSVFGITHCQSMYQPSKDAISPHETPELVEMKELEFQT